jgi:hypothetical protein
MESLDHEAFVEMAVTLWAIWYAIRRLIHDGEQQSPLSTFLFVRSFIQDLGMVPTEAGHRRKSKSGAHHPKWLAPPIPIGHVKINVDAATSKTGNGVRWLWCAAVKMVSSWEHLPLRCRALAARRCSKPSCAARCCRVGTGARPKCPPA